MRATIKDVSDAAGVSIKTVSRVLNDEKYVAPDTRRRIEAAMAALQFHPNTAARALAGGKTFQIALICDNPSPFYVYEVQYGVRERCAAAKVRMIAQPYDRGSPTLVDEIVGLIEQTRPDGLILTPPATDYPQLLAELARRGTPFVRISPGGDVDIVSSVHIDNQQAAADMVAHLVGLGHRRIGFVVGHPGYATSGQRLEGYYQGMNRAGLAIDTSLVCQGQFDFASGATAGNSLLTRTDRPTAIFASSDDMAAGVLATAHRLGLRVPDDVSIAGFDDNALAEAVWPPLTTIHQPTRRLGFVAADLLLDSGQNVRRTRLDHLLVLRGSTGPAA